MQYIVSTQIPGCLPDGEPYLTSDVEEAVAYYIAEVEQIDGNKPATNADDILAFASAGVSVQYVHADSMLVTSLEQC